MHAEDQIVRRHRLGAVAAPLAQHQRRHQPGDAGIDVHHGAAGEIEHPGAVEEPVGAPHPMRDRGVDEQAPQPDEPQERGEFHAIGDGAADQRRGDDRKGHLKAHVDRFGDGRGQTVDRVHRHPDQQEPAQTAEERRSGGKGEAVADHGPQHGDEAGHGKALHHRRQHVHLADHAAIEQRQAGDGHHQDQRHRGQHPGGVAAVELRSRGPGRHGHRLGQSRRGRQHHQAGGDRTASD